MDRNVNLRPIAYANNFFVGGADCFGILGFHRREDAEGWLLANAIGMSVARQCAQAEFEAALQWVIDPAVVVEAFD